MLLTHVTRAIIAKRVPNKILHCKPKDLKAISVRFRSQNQTEYSNGAIKPKPIQTPFALLGVVCSVVPGLFVGAFISKTVANFLEENELFVPSDDDDDED